MDSKDLFTEREVRDRKVWLWVFLVGLTVGFIGYVLIAYRASFPTPFQGSHIEERLLKVSTFVGLLSFPLSWTVAYLTYYFCYLYDRTLLLSFALFGYGFSIAGFFIGWGMGTIPIDPLLVLSTLSMVVSFYYTWKLRKMNKVSRCYSQFPELCQEVCAFLGESGDSGELVKIARKKWPILKPVINREFKKKTLSSI